MFRLLSLRKQFCSAVQKLKYRFEHGSSMIPHPEKEYKGGEDALFVSDNVLLVADGVGGWAESGVDPALYSKRLAKLVEELLEKDKLKYIEDPKSLIKDAVQLNKETGSTTVCLLTLHPHTGILQCYYLGDSVYAIINPTNRQYRVAPQQQYSFNFPVQIGTNGENPEKGMLHTYKPEEITSDELLVVASDGIWDNVKDYMIYDLTSTHEWTLTQRATEIAQLAKNFGLSSEYESPFYLKAKAAKLNYPKQGKLDDNSVIVAKIIKEQL